MWPIKVLLNRNDKKLKAFPNSPISVIRLFGHIPFDKGIDVPVDGGNGNANQLRQLDQIEVFILL